MQKRGNGSDIYLIRVDDLLTGEIVNNHMLVPTFEDASLLSEEPENMAATLRDRALRWEAVMAYSVTELMLMADQHQN
jgi:hypothetical protein